MWGDRSWVPPTWPFGTSGFQATHLRSVLLVITYLPGQRLEEGDFKTLAEAMGHCWHSRWQARLELLCQQESRPLDPPLASDPS